MLEIPLSDDRKGFGRYLHREPSLGQVLQVYDVVIKKNEEIDITLLKNAKDLFPPIFVGISGSIQHEIWKIVGYLPVENYTFPGVIEAHWDGNPPIVHQWFFWDGNRSIRLGPKLPEEYKIYEWAGTYAAPDIAERIETGGESFVKELIRSEDRNK